MQQWFTIIQGTGTLVVLTVAIVNLITVNLITARRGSGMAPPFGRQWPRAVSGSRPVPDNGANSRASGGPVRRYLCFSVDVQGYGGNDDVQQAEIQRDLIDLLDRAGERAALDRRRWIRQPKGDEELALIPADEPMGPVVGEFCLELAAALWRYNGVRDPTRRMRLRLALDDGPVDLSPNGFAGRAVVGVSRLVNARPLRQALDLADRADLAAILSDGVYRDWVHSGRSSVRPEWCRRVAVAEKEYVADAWLWLPGADVHRLALPPHRPDRGRPRRPQR